VSAVANARCSGSATAPIGVTPIGVSARYSPREFAELRRRTVFEHGKWDPQFEDECVLADFALHIGRATWRELAALAEALARETLAAERELVERPELHRRLGLPRAIRRCLRECGTRGPARGAARVMRFDFHWTRSGWRISEVNSDVPGGFIEASGFSRLAAELLGLDLAGDPSAALADAVVRTVGAGARVALVHATAYTDDRQVMLHLARALEARGLATGLLDPTQVVWRDGRAGAELTWFHGPIDLVLRFFPAEWLPNARAQCDWRSFFAGSRTPISNPGAALLVQSKRFPLVWAELATELPTWRALLPETRSPRDADWRRDDGWILKLALGRVGEDVGVRGVVETRAWKRIARAARWWPGDWVAQRRFEAVALEHDDRGRNADAPQEGALHPCLGVYVVDGRAAGIYGRVARRPLVDARSRDVPVLVVDTGEMGGTA
jgi:glutathionylspermidine synthase